MKTLRTPLSLVFLFIGLAAIGQPLIPHRGPTLSAGAQMAIPRGEYAEAYDGNPMGVNAAASFPLWGLPLEIGAGFSWNEIAGQGSQVYISDNMGGGHEGELKIKGNAYAYMAHARLRPFDGGFRPYGEVFAGMRNYSVKSKLYLGAEGEHTAPPETEVSNRDYTWTRGWAVGVQVRLFPAVFLEGRFEQTTGDRGEYIDPASIDISPNGSYGFETKASRTDQYAVSLGIALGF